MTGGNFVTAWGVRPLLKFEISSLTREGTPRPQLTPFPLLLSFHELCIFPLRPSFFSSCCCSLPPRAYKSTFTQPIQLDQPTAFRRQSQSGRPLPHAVLIAAQCSPFAVLLLQLNHLSGPKGVYSLQYIRPSAHSASHPSSQFLDKSKVGSMLRQHVHSSPPGPPSLGS